MLFLGEDVTDEDAFAWLGDGDVGVEMGPGSTLARYRVDDPEAVVGLLTAALP